MSSTYNDMYNYENFPSDDEYELEENQLQLDEEEHFDKYCDILNETFNDMKKYTENCDNPELLQHLTNYMELDTLIVKNKYEFSTSIIQSEKKKNFFYNDDIYIPGPVTWSDDEDDENKEKNQKNNFVILGKKNNKKIPLKQKYKQLRRKRMTKNTKNILSNYLK